MKEGEIYVEHARIVNGEHWIVAQHEQMRQFGFELMSKRRVSVFAFPTATKSLLETWLELEVPMTKRDYFCAAFSITGKAARAKLHVVMGIRKVPDEDVALQPDIDTWLQSARRSVEFTRGHQHWERTEMARVAKQFRGKTKAKITREPGYVKPARWPR